MRVCLLFSNAIKARPSRETLYLMEGGLCSGSENKEWRRTHHTPQWVKVQEKQSGEKFVHRGVLILIKELFISRKHYALEVPSPPQVCTSQALLVFGKKYYFFQFLIIWKPQFKVSFRAAKAIKTALYLTLHRCFHIFELLFASLLLIRWLLVVMVLKNVSGGAFK